MIKDKQIIKIGTRRVSIVMDDFLIHEGAVGKAVIEKDVIMLSPSLSQSALHETLLHEILHFCVYLAGIEEIDGKVDISEEDLVNRITPFLLQTILENDVFIPTNIRPLFSITFNK